MRPNRQSFEINSSLAVKLIEELKLSPGDSFSNNAPSDLCYEYRMETGYWLPDGNSRLIFRQTTKDENDEAKYITRNFVQIRIESFGVDDEDEEISFEKLNEIRRVVRLINEIASVEAVVPEFIESLPISQS